LRYGHFEVETDISGFPIALGAGAMAVTYRARDTVLNSIVALKVISLKLAEGGSTAWCADRNFAHMAFAFASALP